MKKLTLATMILLCPLAAHADPVSLALALSTLATSSIYLKIALVVASAAYGAYSSRRAQKKMAAAARAQHNAGLEDRTLTQFTSIPAWRVIYGRAVVGCEPLAMFTTDKMGTDDGGNSYTKVDGYKHIVMHVASHECHQFHDTIIAGVNVGPLTVGGWAQIWTENRTIAFTGSVQLPYDCLSVVSATDGTTAQTVTVSSDKRTLTGPSGVRVKVVYQAKRDDFSKGNEVTRTASITISGGGVDTETVLETPTQIVNALHVTGSGDNIQFTDATSAVSVAGNVITVTSAFLDGRVDVTYTTTPVKSSVRISYHLGTPGQVVDSYLNGLLPAKWTANHKLEGLTYAVITLDLEDSRFQGGPPQVSFDVSGRLLFDPRTSTTAFSDNSALVINDFLKNPWGYSCDDEDIDQDDLIQAANDCDVTTTFKEVDDFGITTTTTGPRYTTNGAFQTTDSREGVLDDLADSMAGDVVDGPRWSIRAGVWSTPVMDLDDDMLAGPLEIVQTDSGIDEVFNAVRGTFMAIGATSQSEFEPYRNSTMISADGEELSTDIALPFTNARARCTNIARIAVERSRGGLILTYPAQMPAWPLRVGERVRLTNDELQCTNKHFKITDWQNSVRTPVILTLHEDEPDFYDTVDSVKADPTVGINLPNPWFVPPVQNIVILSGTNQLLKADDGTVVVRAQVIWDPMTNSLVTKSNGRIEVWYQRHRISDGVIMDYQRAPAAEEGINYTYISGLNDGDIITVKVYAVNDIGIVSTNKYATHAVVGKSQPPSDVTGVTSSAFTGVLTWNWDFPPDADYGNTEIRSTDANWGSLTVLPIWKGKSNQGSEVVLTAGTYVRYFRHLDTSGIPSLHTTTASKVIVAADLAPEPVNVNRMEITPPTGTLYTDYRGIVNNFSLANAQVKIKDVSGTDITGTWTLTKTDSGVSSSLSGLGALTVSAFVDPEIDPAYAGSMLRVPAKVSNADVSIWKAPVQINGSPSFSSTGGPFSGTGYLQFVASGGAVCRLLYGKNGTAYVTGKQTNWSFSTWMYLDSYTNTLLTIFDSANRDLVLAAESFGTSGTRWRFQSRYFGATGSDSSSSLSASVTGTLLTAAQIPLSTWHFVEVTWNYADKTLRVFLNGVNVGSNTIASDISVFLSHYTVSYPNLYGVCIGSTQSYDSGSPAYPFNGRLADVDFSVGGSVHTTTYSVPTQLRGTKTFNAASSVLIHAESGLDILETTYPINTISSAQANVELVPTRLTGIVRATWEGVANDFTDASATFNVKVNGIDDTSNWSIFATSKGATAEILFSVSGKTVTVTGMETSRTTSTVILYLANPLYPPIYYEYVVTKIKESAPQSNVSISPSTMFIDAVASTGQVLASSYSGKVWNVKVLRGSTDETSSWTIAASASLGSTVTVSNPNITLTSMPTGVDRDTINVTLTRTGYPMQQLGLQLIKNKNQPTPGLQVGSNFAQDAFGYATAGPATSGVKFSSDGGIYLTENGSTWSLKGYWYWPLTGGAGSSHTIDLFEQGPATLTTSAGASVSLASDRQYTLSRSTTGYEADNLRFRIYNGGGDYMWTYIMLEVQRT